MCSILGTAEPTRNGGAFRATFRCTEHDMPMAGPISSGDLCSIGRIEKAAEEAIAKIDAATKMLADAAAHAAYPAFLVPASVKDKE